MKSAIVAVLAALAVTATLDARPAAAQTPAGAAAQSAAAAPETTPLADGEVLKVDKAAGKLRCDTARSPVSTCRK